MVVLLLICFYPNLFAQWSSDPSANLQICDLSNDQTDPRIASTSEGGCYISWFDNRNGDYAFYLQRLDVNGNKLFESNGLLVSDHPQNGYLVNHDLKTDNNDNAIITFSDIRDNDSLHVYAYLIDTLGNFLWGVNGIRLSGPGNFQPSPVVTQTSDGNYVFSWVVSADTEKIALQKISPEGQKLWGTNPVIYSSGTDEDYTNPLVIASDNGSAILVNIGYSGPFWAPVTNILAQKFDQNGNTLWGVGGVQIQNLGGVGIQSYPNIIDDGNNGAFIGWADDRDGDNIFNTFVQHLTPDGTTLLQENGFAASLLQGVDHSSPSIAYLSSTDELFAFWVEKTSVPYDFGIYGQKFNSSGLRIWSDNGMSLVELEHKVRQLPLAQPTDSSIYVTYIQGDSTASDPMINAFMINSTGNFSWSSDIENISEATQGKYLAVSTISTDEVLKVAWVDTRQDNGGIYAQNINPNGELGNIYVPVELTSFTSNLIEGNVVLNWMTATETNNRGFEVQRKLIDRDYEVIGFVPGHGTTTEAKSYVFTDKDLTTGKYIYRLKQIDYDGSFIYSNGIEVENNLSLNEYCLFQNYPNPFNPTTKLTYSIPEKGFVTLDVYDLLGKKIAALVNEEKEEGRYEVSFDASNLSSGVYVYNLKSGSFSSVKKMLLLK